MDNVVLRKKWITFDLTLAVISLAVFLFMLAVNLFYCRYIHFGYLALLLVPSGGFYFYSEYQQKHLVSKRNRILNRIVCMLVSILLLLFSMGATLANEILVPVKAPIYYEHALRMYGYPEEESMSHFPKSVPAGAMNVRFFERPEFLQGGSDFVLKYKTNNKEIDDIFNTYAPKALKIKRAGNDEDRNIDYSEVPHLPEDAIGYEEIPSDFDLLILGSHPYQPNDWNHGYTYGVAVSRQRQEVIYWSEYW